MDDHWVSWETMEIMKQAAAENRILTKYSATEMDTPVMSFQGSIIIHQLFFSVSEIESLQGGTFYLSSCPPKHRNQNGQNHLMHCDLQSLHVIVRKVPQCFFIFDVML